MPSTNGRGGRTRVVAISLLLVALAVAPTAAAGPTSA